jgi:hypothetical protein
MVKCIPRDLTIREVFTLRLRKIYKKGCQIFTIHMEEVPKDKVPSVEDCTILKEFKDVFKEIPGLPPKRDIDFFINLMAKETPVSRTPYRMSTPELKELHMQLE